MNMNIEKIEAAKKLGEALEHLVQFTSFYNRGRDSVLPRKFFLKNILGFSEEDCEQIEKELIEEAAYKKYLDKKIEARMRQMEVDGDFDEICEESMDSEYPASMANAVRASYALKSR